VARRSLKPQLNQIRTWVGQGRTDAWIAHQLEVSVGELVSFKREHDLAPPEEGDQDGAFGGADEDLRAQDDALVAAALDAEPDEEPSDDSDEDTGDGGDGEGQAPRRRRGRRGGRGRRAGARPRALEGTFDHGEEGYGLWLDPAIQDDPTYAEHWAGHRPVTVAVERDRIVIRRAGEDGADEGEADSLEGDGPDESDD
jgi:hypothetical protein